MKKQNTALVKTTRGLSEDQIALIKSTIAKGCTDDELKMFVSQCDRTGLDPFTRQIYALKQWDSKEGREIMRVQISVDGFRLIAERSGKYAGQTPSMWCGGDAVWRDVWLEKAAPLASRAGVLHRDFKEPLYAVAKFDSYAARKKDGSLNPMWSKMPEVMLAKVAESLALRKAFPQELSGLYSVEEMDQATDTEVVLDVNGRGERKIIPVKVVEGELAKASPATADFTKPLEPPMPVSNITVKMPTETEYVPVPETREPKALPAIIKKLRAYWGELAELEAWEGERIENMLTATINAKFPGKDIMTIDGGEAMAFISQIKVSTEKRRAAQAAAAAGQSAGDPVAGTNVSVACQICKKMFPVSDESSYIFVRDFGACETCMTKK